MKDEISDLIKRTLEEAQPSDKFERVTQSLARESDKQLIDEILLKRARTWSFLGPRLVCRPNS